MIVESHEISDNRQGSTEYQNGRIISKDTRTFRVTVDNKLHDAIYVLANATSASPDPIPVDMAQHPTNPSMRCKARTASQEGGGDARSWIVTCNYDNTTSEQDAEDAEKSPLDRRTKFHLEFTGYSRVLERDIDGNPIVNTVGDPFEDPLEEEDERPVLVARKNYDASLLGPLMSLIVDYRGAVNTDEFISAPPGSVRIAKVQMGELQIENDVEFYAVSWYFEFKEEYEGLSPETVEGTPEAWDRLVLNQGYRAYRTANDPETVYEIPDKKEKKLKEDGRVFGTDEGYFYRTFRTKKRRPFSVLGLV